VALTRARERLVLCGTLQPPPKGKKPSGDGGQEFGWLDAVRGRLPGLRDAIPGAVGTGPLLCRLLGNSVGSDKLSNPSEFPPPESVGCFEDRSRPYRQSLDLAVTTVVSRPDADRLEMPAELLWESSYDEEEEWRSVEPAAPLIEASAFGQLLHETLQHADLALDPPRAVDSVLAQLKHRVDAPSVARAREEALRFLTSPIGSELRRSAAGGRSVFREAPFLYRVRSGKEELGFLRGQVDLMFEGADGKWTLVDYKTSAAHRPEYEDQTRFYAHGLRRLLNGRPHRAVLFYTGSGESREVDLASAGTEAFEAELVRRYADAVERAMAGK
jgi:ATP-dependent exoDNAse (exonuclease V) beta subunit